MTKVNKRIVNVFYALIYQSVMVPLLGFITYIVYDKLAFMGVVQESQALFCLLVVLMVAFNVICIYGIAYLYNRVYKASLFYYTITGMITMFIGVWIKVYYIVLENANCIEVSNVKCLDALKYNKVTSTILIIIAAYYFIYHVLYKMLDKNKEGEKKQ